MKKQDHTFIFVKRVIICCGSEEKTGSNSAARDGDSSISLFKDHWFVSVVGGSKKFTFGLSQKKHKHKK